MSGIYTGATESSYKTDEQIIREANIRDTTPDFIDFEHQLPDWKYWNTRFARRADEYMEAEEHLQNSVEIQLPNRPAILNCISDIHVGGPHTNYRRIEQEVETIIATPDSYVLLLGDEADAYFWAETAINDTVEQIPEQYFWYRELIRYLSDNNRLLALWEGNHTAWTRRVGRSFQSMIGEVTEAPAFSGVAYIQLNVGETQYKIAGSHQFPGSSQYSGSHPEERFMRFGSGANADIVIGGHNHKKELRQHPFHKYGDETDIVTLVSLGPYKTHDSYGNVKGFSRHTPNSMFGVSLVLDNERKQVLPYYDILEAHNGN